METVKVVVSGKGTKPNSILSGEDVDTLLDFEYEITKPGSEQVVKRHSPGERTIKLPEKTVKGDLGRKPLSKILRTHPKTDFEKAESSNSSTAPKRRGMRFRFATAPKNSAAETSPHKRSTSTRKRSPQFRHRSSRDGRPSRERQPVRRIPRSTSSQEGLPRVSSLKKLSLPRSSSERQYRTEVLRVPTLPPRSISRRWQDDDYGVPKQQEEGELDSFFRFMEECTKAVWTVLKEIPLLISQLPERTMEILKQLIPALRGPTVPLIEGPRNEDERHRSNGRKHDGQC